MSFPIKNGDFHSYVSLPEGKSGWWCNNMCNNHLEKYDFVNGKDYSIMENKSHVPNHQPVDDLLTIHDKRFRKEEPQRWQETTDVLNHTLW